MDAEPDGLAASCPGPGYKRSEKPPGYIYKPERPYWSDSDRLLASKQSAPRLIHASPPPNVEVMP